MKPTEKLFKIGWTRWHLIFKELAAEAGIPRHKRHCHVLRHTCAMMNIKSAGVENARQYLGHKNGASTLEYLKVTNDEASAAMQANIPGLKK
jgi:integrase